MDPHTFSEGNWVPQAYINSLQSPSEKVCGSIGCVSQIELVWDTSIDSKDLLRWNRNTVAFGSKLVYPVP